MQVKIYFKRANGKTSIYTEGFLEDNGARLETLSVVPLEYQVPWSKRWQAVGLLQPGQVIKTVRKYLFYREYFSVMEFRDAAGHLLGYYCDIATPLRKIGEDYQVFDLCLDLWIAPDFSTRELDWDEFEQAIQQGYITAQLETQARLALQKLAAAVSSGRFLAYLEGRTT